MIDLFDETNIQYINTPPTSKYLPPQVDVKFYTNNKMTHW